MSLLLTSPAFEHNDFIPDEFTCHGLDCPPPLAWENAPPNTKSFVIIMDDPDALGGLWVHWVLFNIPASYNELDAAIDVPDSAISVKNSWGKTGYGDHAHQAEHIDIILGYMLWILFYLWMKKQQRKTLNMLCKAIFLRQVSSFVNILKSNPS